MTTFYLTMAGFTAGAALVLGSIMVGVPWLICIALALIAGALWPLTWVMAGIVVWMFLREYSEWLFEEAQRKWRE